MSHLPILDEVLSSHLPSPVEILGSDPLDVLGQIFSIPVKGNTANIVMAVEVAGKRLPLSLPPCLFQQLGPPHGSVIQVLLPLLRLFANCADSRGDTSPPARSPGTFRRLRQTSFGTQKVSPSSPR